MSSREILVSEGPFFDAYEGILKNMEVLAVRLRHEQNLPQQMFPSVETRGGNKVLWAKAGGLLMLRAFQSVPTGANEEAEIACDFALSDDELHLDPESRTAPFQLSSFIAMNGARIYRRLDLKCTADGYTYPLKKDLISYPITLNDLHQFEDLSAEVREGVALPGDVSDA